MAIISESDSPKKVRYGNTQLQYSLTYVIVTFVVLIILNIYSSKTSQNLVFQSKCNSMLEKAQIAATEISNSDVLSSNTVSDVLSQMDSLQASRLVVTDHTGLVLYDSAYGLPGKSVIAMFPEVVVALFGNDVFSANYSAGVIESRVATPVYTYGTLSGCVYLTETDETLGSLIYSLQHNILVITLILEGVLLVASMIFSNIFTKRLRRILSSMRIIREGDYTHKVLMGGHDELTYLGNEFNELTDKLQDFEHTQRQFVSDASHELKTPLASIKLLTDTILQNDMDAETIKEFVTDIGDEADRLTRMSEKLLSLTKASAEGTNNFEIVDITPTVERVLKMLTGIAGKNNITLHAELVDRCPILVQEDDLYQIVFNLVENGIKYNVPGGSLTVSLHREGENAILKISDTGVGIPEDALQHIFERFYRVDKARSRQTGGSGLGLAIVYDLVHRNRGEMTVQSVWHQGTTFTVTFSIFETGDMQ